jgi:hypothetical protein
MINIAKQNQLMNNIIVYLFNLCPLVHLPHMFRQKLSHYQGGYLELHKMCLKVWIIKC